MRVAHCPIDTALNFVQARKLVRDLKPGCLVLPECYTRPPASAPGRTDLTIEAVGVLFMFAKKNPPTTKWLLRSRRSSGFLSIICSLSSLPETGCSKVHLRAVRHGGGAHQVPVRVHPRGSKAGSKVGAEVSSSALMPKKNPLLLSCCLFPER